tara:strand:+ start:2466 stop:3173 length:708 start_codon:yes stop_codon:yes gene_type:complete
MEIALDIARESKKRGWQQNLEIGLKSISTWDDQIKKEECDMAQRTYKNIKTLYKYTVLCYIRKTNKKRKNFHISVEIPPFSTFLHTFYVNLAEHPDASAFAQDKLTYVERQYILMDIIRNTLHLITSDIVSEHSLGGEGKSAVILPSDSVSNVGKSRDHAKHAIKRKLRRRQQRREAALTDLKVIHINKTNITKPATQAATQATTQAVATKFKVPTETASDCFFKSTPSEVYFDP